MGRARLTEYLLGAAWSDNVYISVTEPVEPLGSTLYLFGQLRSFGSVGDRYSTYSLFTTY